jgi:hypothetical protein
MGDCECRGPDLRRGGCAIKHAGGVEGLTVDAHAACPTGTGTGCAWAARGRATEHTHAIMAASGVAAAVAITSRYIEPRLGNRGYDRPCTISSR